MLKPCASERAGREGGSEVQAPSQDIGLAVLVMVARPQWRLPLVATAKLLRQEKDEASPCRECGRDSLSAFILRFAGGEGFFVDLGDLQITAFPRAGLQP